MTDATQPRVALGTRLPACILGAALFALLALAPFASAASDPIGSGTSKMYFKKGFKKKLSNLNVKVVKYGNGMLNNQRVAVSVTGGSIDPLTGKGVVNNHKNGGFKLKYGKRTVPIREIEVNTNKKWVRATIANATMKLGFLSAVSFAREGFGVNVKSTKLTLTGKAARRINNKLGLKHGLKGGRVISNAYSATQPSEASVLAVNSATLKLSAAAVKKLAHVGTPPYPEGFSPVAVALKPVAPTSIVEAGPPPTVAFPISGGALAPAANAGTLQTSGGLQLIQNLEEVSKTEGDITTLTMGNIWVDMKTLQASVEVTIENPKTAAANLGNIGRNSIADISLVGATVSSDPTTRTISVQNATATLQAVTAETLNAVFIDGLEQASELFKGQEKFAGGDLLGTFSFTAQTQ